MVDLEAFVFSSTCFEVSEIKSCRLNFTLLNHEWLDIYYSHVMWWQNNKLAVWQWHPGGSVQRTVSTGTPQHYRFQICISKKYTFGYTHTHTQVETCVQWLARLSFSKFMCEITLWYLTSIMLKENIATKIAQICKSIQWCVKLPSRKAVVETTVKLSHFERKPVPYCVWSILIIM